MKKILITGGSGFLGTAIIEKLIRLGGYEIIVLDLREPRIQQPLVRFVKTDLSRGLPENQNFKNPYAVINLAGKTIAGRWTKNHKDLIYKTRVHGTRNLVALFQNEKFRPEVLVNASAVGFYGDAGKDICHEDAPVGKTYLAMVARDWEEAAWEASALGVRVTLMRNGHILHPSGGLLGTLLPLYRLGLGGPLGSGKQYFPWVSLRDAAAVYVDALDARWAGPVNVVSPEQITNTTFSLTVATALARPHLFRVPVWALRILYGSFADEIVVSQKVYPGVLKTANFHYHDENLSHFLQDVLGA